MKGRHLLLYLILIVIYTAISYISFQGVVISMLAYLVTYTMVNWNNKN